MGRSMMEDGDTRPAVEVGVVGMTVGYRGVGMGCVALVEMAADAWPLPALVRGKSHAQTSLFFN